MSELVSLRLNQLEHPTLSNIRVLGKGRRERVLPLWKETSAALKAWLARRLPTGDPELFLNAGGRAMTRSGLEYILAKHVVTAARQQPSIGKKRVTPHVLRHTCAMHTLQATRDVRKVSLWLGHASLQSTEIYLRADPTEKLEALAAASAPMFKPGRFREPDKLLAMLNGVNTAAENTSSPRTLHNRELRIISKIDRFDGKDHARTGENVDHASDAKARIARSTAVSCAPSERSPTRTTAPARFTSMIGAAGGAAWRLTRDEASVTIGTKCAAGGMAGLAASASAASRASRRQPNTCCGQTCQRRATSDTRASGRKVSATICAFSSADQRRRRPGPVRSSIRRNPPFAS